VVARGEVRWADLGAKTRPVVLLTRDRVINRMSSVLVAPCTTTIRSLPSEVPLDRTDGMPKTCVVNLDNVSSVLPTELGRLITKLSPDRMEQVCDALAVAVGCER
jgi:mRNA interferase MazF